MYSISPFLSFQHRYWIWWFSCSTVVGTQSWRYLPVLSSLCKVTIKQPFTQCTRSNATCPVFVVRRARSCWVLRSWNSETKLHEKVSLSGWTCFIDYRWPIMSVCLILSCMAYNSAYNYAWCINWFSIVFLICNFLMLILCSIEIRCFGCHTTWTLGGECTQYLHTSHT